MTPLDNPTQWLVPGAWVSHPHWGLGIATRPVDGGRLWVVALDGKQRIPLALLTRELAPANAPSGAAGAPAAPVQLPAPAPAVAKAACAVARPVAPARASAPLPVSALPTATRQPAFVEAMQAGQRPPMIARSPQGPARTGPTALVPTSELETHRAATDGAAAAVSQSAVARPKLGGAGPSPAAAPAAPAPAAPPPAAPPPAAPAPVARLPAEPRLAATSSAATRSAATPALRTQPPPTPHAPKAAGPARFPPAEPTPSPSAAGAPASRANARQALEALRLGVVPPTGLSRLTVGRDAEQHRVRQLVGDVHGMVVISGGYGAGKTHLVEVAEAEALAAGLLVARATFDPDEVPPSHPLRVYGALINGLRYPEGAGRGLQPLFDRLMTSPEHTEPNGTSAHRWLTPALWTHSRYTGGKLAADMLEWVQGAPSDRGDLLQRLSDSGWKGPRPLTLQDFRTFGQIMAHLLGGIAAWARDAGWRGLLVLLDEAEYYDHLGSEARELANNVLRYLAVAALPDAELPFSPGDIYRGGHAVHKAVAPRFREDQPLAVLCAFTPNPKIDAVLRAIIPQAARLELNPLGSPQFAKLADNVLGMVQEAHPELKADPEHQRRVKAALAEALDEDRVGTTRQAARMLVEHWDLYRLDPARARRALQRR